MANQEHLDILKQGVEMWNQWRQEHFDIEPDLSYSDLNRANLHHAYLSDANLMGAKLMNAYLGDANLRHAYLSEADLRGAILNRADLRGAVLYGADLTAAHFRGADLRETDLGEADLSRADLIGADLISANVKWTIFGSVDLSVVKGLETVKHLGKSYVDIHTIYRSGGNIPEAFLRGIGAPDTMIEYMRSLVGKPIDYYTCFISYSSKDQDFAERLYADLQSKGVRCWFAPEDMKIGDKIRSRIDESIRLYDKLLLVLSEHSVASQWVEHEVETAIGKELEGKPNVLFPIRLDQAIMDCKTGWSSHIRLTRHIGDFTNWKHHDDYQKGLNRLLRDLKAST